MLNGRSFVANIKYDANAQHVILNSTQDYLGVTTRQYSETYLFTRNGKYYSSKRTSENDSLPNPSELGKTEFDNATANYLLNSVIGKFTLNDSAEVMYTGSKTGLDIEVATTTVAEVSGVKTELFTSYSIKNGLVCSVFQRVSEYDKSDVPTVKTENTITVTYAVGVVELPSNIQVQ